VRARISGLVRDASRALSFQPVLQLDGTIDSRVDSVTRDHLLAALRELLSNIARHAGASAATVSVAVGDEVVLRVTDNGSGLPADVIAGSGLRNLRERAAELAGSFTLEPAPGQGTVATWRVPTLASRER
jgi:two-component system sensor histidine kinase DevS